MTFVAFQSTDEKLSSEKVPLIDLRAPPQVKIDSAGEGRASGSGRSVNDAIVINSPNPPARQRRLLNVNTRSM